MTNFNNLYQLIETKYKPRSAWNKGVKEYALELAEMLFENYTRFHDEVCDPNLLEKTLLNGASNWSEYSYGGCSLVCGGQIAERLSTKTELKLTKNGEKQPNKNENWLDVQARALYQASNIVKRILFMKEE